MGRNVEWGRLNESLGISSKESGPVTVRMAMGLLSSHLAPDILGFLIMESDVGLASISTLLLRRTMSVSGRRACDMDLASCIASMDTIITDSSTWITRMAGEWSSKPICRGSTEGTL